MDYGLAQATPVITESADTRINFIRKVYLLTLTGIAFFFLVTLGIGLGGAMGNPAAVSVLKLMGSINPLILLFLLLGVSWAAHALSRVKGIGLLAFYGFSGILALLTSGMIYWALAKGGIGNGMLLIAKAMGVTTITFGALTAFVFISRKDFSFLRNFLFVGLMVGLLAVLAAIVAPMLGFAVPSGTDMGFAIFFTLLFVGYILYDTSNILHHYTTDMVVPAAMALMVDFIMLFRNILYFFISRD